MSLGLILTLAGLAVAGLTSVLGIWMERDPDNPKTLAICLSALILLASGVGMVQAVVQDDENNKLQEDVARMLAKIDEIASNSDVEIPGLNDLVKSELNAQSRNNPNIVKKMAQNVADSGGDPNAVLGSYLPPAQMQEMGRSGKLKVKEAAIAKVAVGAPPSEKPRDRVKPSLADVMSGKAPLPGGTAPSAAPTAAPPPPPPPPTEPPTVAAAPTAPQLMAAARKPAIPASLPVALPAGHNLMMGGLKAAAPAPLAAAGASAEDARRKAVEAQQAAMEARKAAAGKAEAEAKAKADAAKKKAADAAAAAKKKVDDAKKKLGGGLF